MKQTDEEKKKRHNESSKRYYHLNRERVLLRLKNNVRHKRYQKAYLKSHKKEKANYNKKYAVEHKDQIRAKRMEHRIKNKQQIAKTIKAYKIKHKKEIKKHKAERRRKDPLYKLAENIRAMIVSSFKKRGWRKISKTYKILGCTFEVLKKHFEFLFVQDMNWDNYGLNALKMGFTRYWVIDHKIPLSSAKTKQDIIKLNNYKNLQPLWYEENMEKFDKLNWERKL